MNQKGFVAQTMVVIGCLIPSANILGWSEGGHHLIAQMAFERLMPETQDRLVELLEKHPRFKEDFKKPDRVTADEYKSWVIGRAAFWPDVARRSTWDRPNWHFQLGSSLSVGDVTGIQVPIDPLELPSDANLASKDLYIVQAFQLCMNIFKSTQSSDADKAVALCWILHLAGDAHQPCHAGSLYQNDIFPEGDRGGNSIPTVQSRNMHALWDGLLGPRYNKGDIRRRIVELEQVEKDLGKSIADKSLDCKVWIQESRVFAKNEVYSAEVIEWLSVVVRSQPAELTKLKLSEEYLKNAGSVAQVRAIHAAKRIEKLLSDMR